MAINPTSNVMYYHDPGSYVICVLSGNSASTRRCSGTNSRLPLIAAIVANMAVLASHMFHTAGKSCSSRLRTGVRSPIVSTRYYSLMGCDMTRTTRILY